MNYSKWGQPALGLSGGQVTWSFAGTGTGFFVFDAAIQSSDFQALVRAAFQAWEDVANIDFVEVTDSDSSNMRLGWDFIDGASNTVGEASWWSFTGPNGVDQTDYAEIAFDTSEVWTANANANANDISGAAVNFYAVALHEIGHAIGLGHTEDPNTIMYSYTTTTVDLAPGDIAGAQAIYGSSGASNFHIAGTAGPDLLTGTDAAESFAPGDGNDTVNAGGGNDSVFAGAGDTGNDRFSGGNGDDVLGGGAGNDWLSGDSGNDTLFGGLGNDTVYGGEGLDLVWAGSGDDSILGGAGNDVLGGGFGHDFLGGNDGDDVLYGSDGADFIDGGAHQDTLFGGAGGDTLMGQAGDDVLFNGVGGDQVHAGAGNDVLWGGDGDDELWGDDGNDVFAFDFGNGNDLISDFELTGGDILDLQAFGFTSIDQVLASMANGGAGAVLIVLGAVSVTFSGWVVEDFAAASPDWVLI